MSNKPNKNKKIIINRLFKDTMQPSTLRQIYIAPTTTIKQIAIAKKTIKDINKD